MINQPNVWNPNQIVQILALIVTELKSNVREPNAFGFRHSTVFRQKFFRLMLQDEKESRKERRGGGDNDEEELPDMENNPFALSASDAGGNEKLYSADPKKFLKAW